MDKVKTIDSQLIGQVSGRIFEGVAGIIDNAMTKVAVYVNSQSSMTFWNIGRYIIDDMDCLTYSAYGQKILAMLSQTLSWSHFIELITIENATKSQFPNGFAKPECVGPQ